MICLHRRDRCRRDPVPVVSTGVARDRVGQDTGLRWLRLELPSADRGTVEEPTGPAHPALVETMRLLDSELHQRWT